MSNCIEKDIIDSIIVAVKEVKTGSGWSINIDDSYVTENVFAFTGWPNKYLIIVAPLESRPDDEVANRTRNVIEWQIKIMVQPSDKAIADRYDLTASIRDSIMTNPRRPMSSVNLATLTTITSTRYWFATSEQGVLAIVADIEGFCVVHHAVTNYRGA